MLLTCKMEQKIKLKCQRCGTIWDYKGKNLYVTNCPHCRTSVSVKSRRV